jgi:putative oxidoreductase
LGLEHVWTPRLLSVLRIVTAFLFMMHGSAKILHVPHEPQYDDIALLSLIGIGGLLELVGGFLVLIGLFTRPVAFILSGEMAVAYFMFHAPSAFLPLLNRGDGAVLYCFLFLYLAFAGPGPWSVDAMLRMRRGVINPGRGAG